MNAFTLIVEYLQRKATSLYCNQC